MALISGQSKETSKSLWEVIRQGNRLTFYTVGYEKRSGEELVKLLRDHGIKVLIDVRAKPISRVPDFRAGVLAASCRQGKIEYQSWPRLGSTDKQREQYKKSGDVNAFEKQFRAYAKRQMGDELERLSKAIHLHPTVLLCYERNHFECHRSVIAELVAEPINATVIAFL